MKRSGTWFAVGVGLALALVACKKKNNEAPTTTASGSAVASGSAPGPGGEGSAAGAPEARQEWKDLGLQTPESVLYDADADVYLVSNINGKPADVDDNGFISKIGPDGKVIDLKWIDGAKPDVSLDAPKGSAISGGVLWVADITVVRKFDAKTGKPVGEVKVPGATFLNDVAPAPDGGVYVTDTGVDAAFKSTGADAVYRIASDGTIETLAKSKDLHGPNGVTSIDGKVYVVMLGDNILRQVVKQEVPEHVTAWHLPKGQLDGIVALAKDDFLISSWEGKTVYRGANDTWKDLMLDIEGPADIGWDSKRKLLLVPHFNGNAITIIAP